MLVHSCSCNLCTIHSKTVTYMYTPTCTWYACMSECFVTYIHFVNICRVQCICFVHCTASSWKMLYFGLMCRLSITKLMACMGLSMLCNESRCSTHAGRILRGLWGVPRIGRVELNILEAFSFACRICWFSCS